MSSPHGFEGWEGARYQSKGEAQPVKSSGLPVSCGHFRDWRAVLSACRCLHSGSRPAKWHGRAYQDTRLENTDIVFGHQGRYFARIWLKAFGFQTSLFVDVLELLISENSNSLRIDNIDSHQGSPRSYEKKLDQHGRTGSYCDPRSLPLPKVTDYKMNYCHAKDLVEVFGRFV